MNDYDFTFAFEGSSGLRGPWGHLDVIRFRGREEMSALYRYEIILLARAPLGAPPALASGADMDPADLIAKRATLRIRTLTLPEYRVVHGIIAEAEELATTPDGVHYRVVLVPPLARALYRKRCRIFLEKTTRQIIDAVLRGEPLMTEEKAATVGPDDGNFALFTPAREQYAWRVAESPRIDQVGARPYCVQYNESDLAFVARLLEEEGISYHFENGAEACLLVLSDHDGGRPKLDIPLGHAVLGREVSAMRLGGRLRPKSVSLDDYNWHKPAVSMFASAGEALSAASLSEYSYPGGYPDAASQGDPLARALLQRYGVEASYATGESRCRALAAGVRFSLLYPKPTHEGEYIVTALEAWGEQTGVTTTETTDREIPPYRCNIECARFVGDASNFRPARRTPKPRIQGSQTAFVTAEPSAQNAVINVGDQIGCVRLKFHWDREVERLRVEPSSCWVRVSQMFAGGGEGAVWHPRVGVEVIVEFLEGDPDRPIVTGRVYNGAKIPPAPSVGSPTISTWKSFSVPGGAQYNEIMFDDAAGSEEIRMHAGRDWNTVVERNRTELVKADSASTVGVNRTEATGRDRTTSVGANNTETVVENETIGIGGNQALTVAQNQAVTVGMNQTTVIDGWQKIDIEGSQGLDIHNGNQSVNVKGWMDYATEASATLHARHDVGITADDVVRVSGRNVVAIDSSQGVVTVNGADLVKLESPMLIEIKGGDILVTGGSISIRGEPIDIESTGNVMINGDQVKLNC